MAFLNVGDFRKGKKVILDGEPYELIEVNFFKPGKGAAVYKTRMRNLLNGKMLDNTYRSGDGLEEADVHRTDGIYSYRDGSSYVFMDNDTFEQHSLPAETVEDQMRFCREGDTVGMLFWNGQLVGITPPAHVVLEVTYTEPAVKGDTAGGVTKPATVETGATVQVPAFVNQGDRIKIDAETGAYIERAKD